ncbi:MAG TPA: polysaccharide deacetylase family protein [Draconibacterium sp.]|nr:polysaccharide deacetylase family protein [Draconibacterium sp.]
MILIYSEDISPRIEFVTRLIFTKIHRVEVSFTTNKAEFLYSELPKINYSQTKFNDEIYLKPHGLLTQSTLGKVVIKPFEYNNSTVFFESSPDSVFPFDPFAASFYLVTRYEEYFETELDKFGRFPAGKSILTELNLIKKPVVNIWADWLAKEINRKYPQIIFIKRRFKFISTIDIDNAWAYLNKGFWRTKAALVKSVLKGDISEFRLRRKVLKGKEKDPYHTYDYLDSVFSGNEEKVKFFFLLGDYGKYDKNVSHENIGFQKLILKIAQDYDIGIHPSFAGFLNGCHGKVIRENGRLEKIVGRKISKSRQHYLNLKFPKTYQNLIKAGMTEDYTLGYPDQTGFRAGICTPFNFYDLENEETTNLLVVPFQVMDGTLRNYLKLSPEEAFKETEMLMNEVKKVGGTFVSIWHNESVNDSGEWKGYRKVFEKMNQLGFQWANE